MSTSALHCGIFDLDAVLRTRCLVGEQAQAAIADGYSFPNVVYRWDSGEQVYDGRGPFGGETCRIDEAKPRAHPFEPQARIAIADFTGPSRELSPREALRRQVERAARQGLRAQAAFECEFIVLDETADSLRRKQHGELQPWLADNRCWSGETMAVQSGFIDGLLAMLEQLDIPVFGMNTELGPGCFELTLQARDPLKAADDFGLLRTFTKAYCRRQDKTASFMAQLGAGFPGLSGHLHLSLRDAQGRPLFGDRESGMSALMEHFVAGVLTLLPDGAALCAHTVNAWRRMVPGNWSPRSPSWAVDDYGAAVRVVLDRPDTTRIEFRVPAADTHPHLALAFVLGAGLWGIERGLPLPEPARGDPREFVPAGLRPLPRTLGEAAERLAACTTARELFGAAFIDHFAATRAHEDAALRRLVSAQERARYL